jgi:MoaA/NifB/PqqE/SkfB family radical SAM enzyme
MSERFVVVWRVTTRCNLACPFCAYDRTLARPRPDADANLIARTGPALAQWSELSGRPVLVSWLGGEPLLWPPLTGLSLQYRGLGLQLSTTTNGTPLSNPAVRRHLVENYTELTVSVDALGEEHDRLRNHRGLFPQVSRSVREVAAEISAAGSALLLRANVVLMRRNADDFGRLCRELASWGIREITCNQLGGADRPEFFPDNRLLPAQVEQLQQEWPELQNELARSGVRLLGSETYLRRMAASTRGERLDIADCSPGRHFVFVDESGRTAPCSFTGDEYGVAVNDLTSAGAWNSLPSRFTGARRCHRSSRCSDCLSTRVFQKFAPSA